MKNIDAHHCYVINEGLGQNKVIPWAHNIFKQGPEWLLNKSYCNLLSIEYTGKVNVALKKKNVSPYIFWHQGPK